MARPSRIRIPTEGIRMNWYLDVLKKYAVFQGRSRRKEYWMFSLVNLILVFGLVMIEGTMGLGMAEGLGMLSGLYMLLVLLPSLAVSVRRLHDTGRSGWWLLIAFIPLIGALVLLFFNIQDSELGENEYGVNPKPAFG
jgi:uncharacterized membrane protein YhaH (DUF805 family)